MVDINENALGFYGALVGAGAYFVLMLYVLLGMARGATGRALLAAAATTSAAIGARLVTDVHVAGDMLEIASAAAWFGVILRVLGVGRDTWGNPEYAKQFQLAWASGGIVLLALLVSALGGLQDAGFVVPNVLASTGTIAIVKLLLYVLGLALVEQLFRNTRRDFQWNMKFMSFGLAVNFGFAFVMYADNVLFARPNDTLITVSGFVYTLAVPFIIIASSRSSRQVLNVNISREFAFRSGVLFATGSYLLLMSAAGYYLRVSDSTWGEALQALFVVVSLLALAVLAASTQVRNYIRVVIERNLFEYKYDYRTEWRRITNTLTRPDADLSLGQRVVLSLADLLHVRQGALWWREEDGRLLPYAQYLCDWTFDIAPEDCDAFVGFFHHREWVVDLDEYRADPRAYVDLPLSEAFLARTQVRFIVPLLVNDEVTGLVLLGTPGMAISLIWEDYDLLKVSARQAASVMAQHRAAEALTRAQQFEAFHQMSAFIVHDIKTVVAQLSLLVKNAEKHKTNPAFVEDMLRTSDNASRRMQKLLDQLRDPRPDAAAHEVDLRQVVNRALERQHRGRPLPTLDPLPETSIPVHANEEQLCNVIGHILQNAQDATPADGYIRVTVESDARFRSVRIEDNGSGMDEAFVRDRLFSPFDSTKGVTGMGIGVYQSRQFLRSVGGDLRVTSAPGEGSCFVLTLPVPRAPAQSQSQSSTQATRTAGARVIDASRATTEGSQPKPDGSTSA
jgi:putative PEP-CTERM system histidine kinase